MGNGDSSSTKLRNENKSILEKLTEDVKLLGFTNNNNNCYMNSVLQCLINLTEFKGIFKNLKNTVHTSEKNQVSYNILSILDQVSEYKKKIGVLEIKKFLVSVRKSNELFNNDYHHDAHEFLHWLIDFLHESYIKDINSKQNSSVFSQIFQGIQYSITKCLTCENTFKRPESYLNLAVDVEPNFSLTACLKKYIGKELMKNKDKFYCDFCNSYLEAERNLILDTLPKVLIIQLKRFKMMKEICRKISYCVNIPFEINLNFLLHNSTKYQNSTNYHLRSMIVHVGSGLQQGHYFSIVKISDEWFKFDDENIQHLNPETIRDYMGYPDEDFQFNSNTCAYVLFYERSSN